MEKEIQTSVGTIRVFQTFNYKNRPIIVFLHDSLGCIKLWKDFPKKLGSLTHCNIMLYDRQGYGMSCPFSNVNRDNNYMETEADILDEIIDLCIPDYRDQNSKTILFGHSDGGSIALIYGAKYQEKLQGIITEGAHIFVEDETISGIKAAKELYKTTDLRAKLEKYHSIKTDEMFRAWTETWLSPEFREWNIEKFLPRINCPVLAIQGENDEFGTIRQVDGIRTKVSGSSYGLIIPGAKHTPHIEFEELMLEKCKEFILSIVI